MFIFCSEQLQLKEMAKNFADNELKPFAKEWDQNKIFPYETLKQAADLGLAGIFVSEKYGGSELTRLDGSLIFEELSSGCTSTTAYLTIHNMCCWMINTFGNEEQKLKFLPKLTSLEHCSSYCLTEPSHGKYTLKIHTLTIF